MIVQENQKIYQCEHCAKRYISGSSCSRHEKYCYRKPENRHACFQECKNLEWVDDIRGRGFFCKAKEQFMYSYKSEKCKRDHVKDPDFTRMPLQCGEYENKHGGFELPTWIDDDTDIDEILERINTESKPAPILKVVR